MYLILVVLAGLFYVKTDIVSSFNPFMDSDLHMIDWVGSGEINKIGSDEDVIVMKTKANEKYTCVLPQTMDASDQKDKKSYDGPTPDELIWEMFQLNACSYRLESYWTYELCHGKYLRQYHESKELSLKKPQVQEYYLGYYGKHNPEKGGVKEMEENLVPQNIKSKKIDDVELPFYEVNMTDGTVCDINNQPRQVRILYVCQPDGRGEIYEMKETSTCEYEVIVLTAVLCANPKFKPKNPPVTKISCHAMDGSPTQPRDMGIPESRRTESYTIKSATEEEEEEEEEEGENGIVTEIQSKQTPEKVKPEPKVPDNTLTSTTDKQVLRDFLSGDHCLQGGSGWWKHEFCFGKYARQYHDDQEGRTIVYLGQWNEKKHLEWISRNPSKMPKEKGKRKTLSLLFTDGDVCDITGKRRLAEVRLKCVENPNQPHSVSIYLIEPRTCEYILGIESPLFCSILDRADEYGIIKDTTV